MDYKQMMFDSLSALLEEGETLRAPFYGLLVQNKVSFLGFFGLTEGHLLVALLNSTQGQVGWTSRVPLEIKRVGIKKCLLPSQYQIDISFLEGNPCRIKVFKKVRKIDCQEENVTAFMEYLRQYT